MLLPRTSAGRARRPLSPEAPAATTVRVRRPGVARPAASVRRPRVSTNAAVRRTLGLAQTHVRSDPGDELVGRTTTGHEQGGRADDRNNLETGHGQPQRKRSGGHALANGEHHQVGRERDSEARPHENKQQT